MASKRLTAELVDGAAGPCFRCTVTRRVEADYLVVGAGATGMAFTDALIDHADVRVALVDRRQGVGGHWLGAYPFVRLHQSSTFYGAASTLLGGGRNQEHGPEAGLHERADQPTICAYYDDLLADRMLGSGRVEFFAGCDYVGDRSFVSRTSGERFDVSGAVPDRRRPLPRPRHPGGDAAEVRGRRRRAGDPGQRPRASGRGSQPVRRRGLGQDRDRRLHLVAGERRGPRLDLLGETPRTLDAEPGADPAGSRHLPRHGRRHDAGGGDGGIVAGPVPAAGGRRHHAAHRPLGHADHGQGAHPRHVGARAAAHDRPRRAPGPHRHGESRQDRPRRTGRSPSRTTPSS